MRLGSISGAAFKNVNPARASSSWLPVINYSATALRVSTLGFRLFQKVLHKWALVGGQTLAPTAKIKEGITVFKKDRSKIGSGVSHRPTSRMLRVVSARAMIEQDSWERARTGRFPEIPLQAELPAAHIDDLRSGTGMDGETV